MNFDFNINNYNIKELERFLQIEGDYNLSDINQKCNKINSMIKDNPTYDDKYRRSFETFLEEVKLKFASNIKAVSQQKNGFIEDYNSMIINNPITSDNFKRYIEKRDNVGTIINPMATHQSLQKISIPSNSTNPFSGNKFVTNYVFNTQFRDNFFFTQPEECTFTLPIKLKNVIAISLSAVQMPNVMLPFFKNGTDHIYIHEDTTNIEGLVTIPNGYYDVNTFPPILENAINEQLLGSSPNRFKVSINPYTHYITISNSTYTFSIDVLKNRPDRFDNPCSKINYYNNYKPDNIETKNNINTQASKFVTTMGYLIGYRKIQYFGEKSYTGESMFNNIYTDYVYFCMNDYCSSSQYVQNYGVLPQGLINDNILAVIPINTPKFESTFADNSDYIYKTRNYNGPVDIQKISIKLLNMQGTLVYLHDFDFGFNLQVTTIYDITKPYTSDYSII